MPNDVEVMIEKEDDKKEKVLDNLLSSELRALGQYILEEFRREGKIDVNVVSTASTMRR